jgi:hypothetical protein
MREASRGTKSLEERPAALKWLAAVRRVPNARFVRLGCGFRRSPPLIPTIFRKLPSSFAICIACLQGSRFIRDGQRPDARLVETSNFEMRRLKDACQTIALRCESNAEDQGQSAAHAPAAQRQNFTNPAVSTSWWNDTKRKSGDVLADKS